MPKNIFRALVLILALGQASLFAIDLPGEKQAIANKNQPRVLMVKPAPQKIVVSIKPYALIFESIKREGDTVSVLIEDGATAHDFQFRPSHLKKIAEADLVIWGGEKLEPNLVKAIKNSKQLILGDIKALELIEAEPDHRGHASSQGHHREHDTQTDPHIWLSQQNVQEIAKAMAEALYYPKEATRQLQTKFLMMTTADRLRQSKKQEKSSADAMQSAMQKTSALVVYHNAYAYLEKDLGIKHDFVINESHNSQPSLRHWNIFNEQLLEYKKQNRNICFVTLPGFAQSKRAERLHNMLIKNQLEAHSSFIELDPLASSEDYKDYFEFWNDSRKRLIKCLAN